MKCGIKFCGGCNPRYDRGLALEEIKKNIDNADFEIAVESVDYDILLVIGGCSSCCASYEQYNSAKIIKMWQKEHIDAVIDKLQQ